MKNTTRSIISIIFLLMFVTLFTGSLFAQDASKVDPKHYKVEFENDQVRVLRITYGPGEKSVMHYHPKSVSVFLTYGEGKFTMPDGTTQDIKFKDGDVVWLPETSHQPENTGDKPFELIQIEMK